jgi:NTE family protein
VQDRITRSRMAGDPPDIVLAPRLSHIGLLEFYRAREAIQEGRECVRRMLPEIRHLVRTA